jgi:hypothetical protein
MEGNGEGAAAGSRQHDSRYLFFWFEAILLQLVSCVKCGQPATKLLSRCHQIFATLLTVYVFFLLFLAGRYWTWADEPSSCWAAHPAPLPSDVRHRSDLAALAGGDRGASAAQKTRLEQQQRADRKLREAAGVFEHH